MATYIKPGCGFACGHAMQDFDRAGDMPIAIQIATDEFAKPGHVIAYMNASDAPTFSARFANSKGKVRIHVRKDLLIHD